MTDLNPNLRLTDADLRRVLDRAGELDLQSTDLTVRELLEIGVEAGYSEEALRWALESEIVESGSELVAESRGRRLWQALRAGVALGVTFAVSIVTGASLITFLSVLTFIPIALIEARKRMPTRDHAGYQLWVFTSFVAFLGLLQIAGSMMGSAGLDLTRYSAVLGLAWIWSAALGAFLIYLFGRGD